MNDSDIFDPFDMDREEFNPDLCMLRYTEDCSLPNMLSRKNNIDKEINKLQSELQNMLYNNYTKFIDAASVVTTMKTDFRKMEDEIDNLHAKVNVIERTSSGILESLRPTENKISRLLKCQHIMKKLVLLTDLVPTLKMYIESEAFSTAAKYYLKAENLLKKYKHLPSLSGIVKDCAEIVESIKDGLRSKLNCDIYGREEISENLNLILALGETPSVIVKHFLSCSDKNIISHLSSIDSIWEKDQKVNIEKDAIKSTVVNYIGLCGNYIEKIEKVICVIKHVYFCQNDENMQICVNELLDEFFTASIHPLSTKLQQRLTEHFQKVDDNFLSHVLDKFIRQCHSSGIITPHLNLYQKGIDIILKICRARCEFHLENAKRDFNGILLNLEKELTYCENKGKFVVFLEEWTKHKLDKILRYATFYIRPEFKCCREISFRKEFSEVLIREGIFTHFFRHIKDQIWFSLTKLQPKQPIKFSICLILAKYLLNLEKNIIPRFLDKVDSSLGSTMENSCLSSDADILNDIMNSAQKAIEYYVYVRSHNMICMLQKSMENKNWIESKEPIRPRSVVKILLNDILETKAQTEQLFSAYEKSMTHRSKGIDSTILCKTKSIKSLPEGINLEERVLLNKIFSSCSEIHSKVELNTFSIMNCILKKTLKSFLEYVRLNTFNSFGLQQMQVDVCYLRLHTSRLLDFDHSVQSLFDEIIASTCNRSLKAELLSNKIVSVICNQVL